MDLAVFLDWQNLYREARRAFGLEAEPSERGVVSPLAVARVIASRGAERPSRAILRRVEIHRGLPDARRQPEMNAATLRHRDAWLEEARDLVVPHLRPLRLNPATQRWEEKGVDVALAVGALEWVLAGEDRIAVIFSHDTDLAPSVEAIARLCGEDRVETVSWKSETFHKRIPRVGDVYNHMLGLRQFEHVEKPVNFAYVGADQRAN